MIYIITPQEIHHVVSIPALRYVLILRCFVEGSAPTCIGIIWFNMTVYANNIASYKVFDSLSFISVNISYTLRLAANRIKKACSKCRKDANISILNISMEKMGLIISSKKN